jgi:hypothetical protein
MHRSHNQGLRIQTVPIVASTPVMVRQAIYTVEEEKMLQQKSNEGVLELEVAAIQGPGK